MSERAIHIGVLVAALALAGWVFGARAHVSLRPNRAALIGAESPLSIIPPGSAFVLSADVVQLRHAPLGAVLAQRLTRLEPSSSDLPSLCGFDPLLALDQLALAVPSAGVATSDPSQDFAIVASGRFSAEQITRCASAAISQRGGDPVKSQLGSFSSVRDRKSLGGEVAARDRGPLIVSGGAYLRALLDAAEGNSAKHEHEDPRDAHHAALRRLLGPGTIVASWLLPDGWFERLSDEDDARLSPLRALKALGARLDLSEELRVLLLLECADDASAAKIVALLEPLRSALRALPLDPALRGVAERIVTSREGARVRLGLTLRRAELEAALDLTLGPSRPAAGSAH